MELDFPEGSLEKSLSEKMQDSFLEKLKLAVWLIKVETLGGQHSQATGFCVDSKRRLLVTSSKAISNNRKDPIIYARRDCDLAGKVFSCEIVVDWKYIGIAILKVDDAYAEEDRDNYEEKLDYVCFDADVAISRQISLGWELFSIGIPMSRGFHLIRGYLSHQFKNENADYSSLSEDLSFLDEYEYIKDSIGTKVRQGDDERKKHRPSTLSTETNFYVSNSCGWTPRTSFCDDGTLHPHLQCAQMEFAGVQELYGLSGSPIFNSKGKVVSILLFANYGSLYGVSSNAMDALLTTAQTKIDEEKGC